MRILLVEDDDLLGDAVRAALVRAGYAVDWMRDGADAAYALADERYDAVLLDLGLPGRSGLDVLREYRGSGGNAPVLIATAQDAVQDRVAGLDAGADDYVVKPFDLDEVQARLRALMRRAGGRAVSSIRHGAVELDPAAHRVTLRGEPVELSPREFAVLQELLENAGRVLSRRQIEQALYGWDDSLASNAVEVHVHHLRRKLGEDLIRTIRGVGYMVPPAEGKA